MSRENYILALKISLPVVSALVLFILGKTEMNALQIAFCVSALLNLVLGYFLVQHWPRMILANVEKDEDDGDIWCVKVGLRSWLLHEKCLVQVEKFAKSGDDLIDRNWGLKTKAQSYEAGRRRFSLSPGQRKQIQVATITKDDETNEYRLKILYDSCPKREFPPGNYILVLKAMSELGRAVRAEYCASLTEDGKLYLTKKSQTKS